MRDCNLPQPDPRERLPIDMRREAPSMDQLQTPDLTSTISPEVTHMVIDWVAKRVETLLYCNGDPEKLHKRLQELEQSFILNLSKTFNSKEELRTELHAIYRVAISAHEVEKTKLLENEAAKAEERRELLGSYLEADWKAVAGAIGRESISKSQLGMPVDSVLAEHRNDAFQKVKAELIRISTPWSSDPAIQELRRNEMELKFDRQVGHLKRFAEMRAEVEYLRADAIAQELHSLVPRTKSNPQRVFQILWGQNTSQRELAFQIYQERYHNSFASSLESSYTGLRARASHFFKIPALRAALEERYGVEVGLLSAVKVFVPDPRKIKTYPTKVYEFVTNISDKVKAPELSRIESLMQGDRVGAAVDSLHLCLRERSQAREFSELVLKDLTSAERDALLNEYSRKYKVERLIDIVEEAFSGKKNRLERALLISRLEGKDLQAEAISIQLSLEKKGELLQNKLSELETISSSRRAEIMAQYKEYFRVPLTEERLAQYLKKTTLLVAIESLAGNVERAAAARIWSSLKQESRSWVGEPLYDKDKVQRQNIIAEFEKMFGRDFWSEMEKRKGTERTSIMREFIESGKLTELYLVRHCLPTIGADASGLQSCLANLTNSDLQRLKAEYSQTFSNPSLSPRRLSFAAREFLSTASQLLTKKSPTLFFRSRSNTNNLSLSGILREAKNAALKEMMVPADLERDIKRKFCGHHLFDIQEIMKGRTRNPQEMHDRFLLRLLHELGQKHEKTFKHLHRDEKLKIPDQELARRSFIRRKMEGHPISRKVQKHLLDDSPQTLSILKDAKLLNDFYVAKIHGRTPTPRDLQRYKTLLQSCYQGMQNYRQHQLERANWFANISALTVGGTAVGAFVVLGTHYLLAAPIAATCLFASRYWTRAHLIGEGYGRRQIMIDGSLAIIEGSTFALSKFFQGSRLLMQMGFSSQMSRLALSSAGKFALKRSLLHLNNTKLTNMLLEDQQSGHARKTQEIKALRSMNEVTAEVETRESKAFTPHERIDKLQPLEGAFSRIAKGLN